jgi:serine/threonine protein phosphatase PrpC
VLVFDAAAASWQGPRPDNQDSAVASARLLAVADGVGGNQGGATASSLVVAELVHRTGVWEPARRDADVREAISAANRRIATVVREQPRLRTMATTLVAAVIAHDRVTVVSVGDSRAYLLANGVLQQVTRDHTLVQVLVDSQRITPAEAATHPQRSLLHAALTGDEGDIQKVDAWELDVAPGDRLLLCSDGLSDVMPLARVADLLGAEGAPGKVAAAVLAAAADATDNVTVVVADIRETLLAPLPYAQTAGAVAQLQQEPVHTLGDTVVKAPVAPVPRGWERSGP